MASDSASAMVPWRLRYLMLLRIKRLLTYSHQNGYASPFSSHATRKREKRISTHLEKKNDFNGFRILSKASNLNHIDFIRDMFSLEIYQF